MARHEVRQYTSLDLPPVILAVTNDYDTGVAKRQENGLRLAAYHGLPITLELWMDVSTDSSTTNMVFVSSLTTQVIFGWDDPEYSD